MFCAETIGGFSVGHAPVLHLHSPPLQALGTGRRTKRIVPPQIWSGARAHSEQLLVSNALPRLINLKRACFCVY